MKEASTKARAVLLGLLVSLVAIAVFSLTFSVRFEDILQIGARTFALAGFLALLRLFVQGIRFHLLAMRIIPNYRAKFHEGVTIRIASEAISLITPSYIGGEALRVTWLMHRKLDIGAGLLVVALEIFADVIVGSLLTLAGSAILMMRGEVATGIFLAVIGTSMLGFYLLLFVGSSRGSIEFPRVIVGFARRFFGESRSDRFFSWFTKTSKSYTDAFSRTHGYPLYVNLALSLAHSILLALLSGLILHLVFEGGGVPIGLTESVIASYVSLTFGSIPITPGGSGLSEVGVYLFTGSLVNSNPWSAIITWRVASYHVPLVLGISFLLLVVPKFLTKSSPKDSLQRES